MRMTWCFILAFGAIACNDAPPTRPTPVDPTPTDPPIVTPDPNAPPAQFDDRLWRELVFNGHDDPGGLATATSQVLSPLWTPARSAVYVVEHPALTDARFEAIDRVITDMVADVTGERWVAPIFRMDEFQLIARSTTIEFVNYLRGGSCGRATIGSLPAHIRIRADHECIRPGSFEELVAHEYGHVLGFQHVSDWNMLMFSGGARRPTYRMTGDELWHARLAYETGRGQRYCGGWPVDC